MFFAACWMACSAVRDRMSRKWFTGWLCFGLPAVLLALPQLLIWTFRSVGGNSSFLRFHFDWVNGGQENWFWFWLKNIGPMFVIFPAAYVFSDKEQRAEYSGVWLIFILSELVVFQPNVYDNNKLLYVAYMFVCCLGADAVVSISEKWRSSAKTAFLIAMIAACCNAGVLTLAREAVSGIPRFGYELFSRDEVAAGEFILEHTSPGSVFLTDDNHDNTVAVLTGRNIVCGSSSYLYFHGLDYTYQQRMAERMLTDAESFEKFRTEFNVDFVYMGYHENAMPGNILPYLSERYPEVFSSGAISIFDVR